MYDLLTHTPLFAFALQEEATHEFTELEPLFVGVGKLNAAFSLMQQIAARRPSIIVNLGSAGSQRHARGTVVCCSQFIQRDMDVTALGFEKYVTPFTDQPVVLRYGLTVPGLPEGVCGSGDSFEVNHTATAYDVIDMEAYALAWVAMKEQIPFLCLKYISDGADGKAATDWQTSVRNASSALKNVIHKLRQPQHS